MTILIPLVITTSDREKSEPFIDYEYSTFKEEYEKNGSRSISLTIYKTSYSADVFNLFQNDNILLWEGQEYIIKSTSVKYDGMQVSSDIQAEHIMFEFQNHYLEKESSDDDDDSTEESVTMSLKDYIEFCFKDNGLGYSYEIKGTFKEKQKIESLGEKNAMEHLTEGAETFGYIYHADNKKIYIHDDNSFYRSSDVELRYKYNTTEMSCSINSSDVKTYVRGYGKKITTSERKGYNAVKTPKVTLNGKFDTNGTYKSERVGDSYVATIDCKYGNETVTWTLKQMSKGGQIRVKFDGEDMGEYSCYSKNAQSKSITIKKNVKKGKHSLTATLIGPKKGVNYKKSNPCIYVGTEKSTVLSSEAKLTGKNAYHAYVEYKSPNYDPDFPKQAPSVYSDDIKNNAEMLEKLKKELQDEPTIEMSTTYSGSEELFYNDKIWFIHEPTGISGELKVVKITKSHPYANQPDEIEFSNTKTDILKIQQQINNTNIKQDSINRAVETEDRLLYSDIVGVTLLDD